jgi:hypothetical protein
MVELRVNPEFHGPTILELDSVIANVQGPVEVRWQGTKAEYAALERYPRNKFVLYVPDLPGMERAATVLGQPYILDTALLVTAHSSLASRKAYNWRAFSEGVGTAITRSILTRLSAGAIRLGKPPRFLAKIASECIIEGVNPIDADVLLRLRYLRGN